jgi:hypothetical protein
MPSTSNATHLQAAVEQCIDAVCFEATHFIDDDLHAQSKDGVNNVRQLQAEQRRRIDALYGPATASPDYLAQQLDMLYKADALSVTARGDDATAIDEMSDITAKMFKKELKQRIHEWEGVYRATYGHDATPHDKVKLRSIYELYKAVKARSLRSNETSMAVTAGNEVSSIVPPTAAPAARPVSAAPSPPAAVAHESPAPQAASDGSAVWAGSIAAVATEKKTLKKRLHQFEDDFKAHHGRAPNKEERKPLQREYQRYGELKATLSAASNE